MSTVPVTPVDPYLDGSSLPRGEDEDEEETWGSREQATAHQLRRLSSQANGTKAASRMAAEGETVRNDLLLITSPLGTHPPPSPPSVSSLGDIQLASKYRLPSAPEDQRGFASTAVPSLRTLSDDLASLQRDFISVRATDAVPAAAARLSSAPASRWSTAAPPAPSTRVSSLPTEPSHELFPAPDHPQGALPLSPAPRVPAFALQRLALPAIKAPEEGGKAPAASPQQPPTPRSSSSSVLFSPTTERLDAAALEVPTTNAAAIANDPAVAEMPLRPIPALREAAEGRGEADAGARRRRPTATGGSSPPLRSRQSRRAAPVLGAAESPSPRWLAAAMGSPTTRRAGVPPVTKSGGSQQQGDASSLLTAEGGGKSRDGRIKVVVRKRPFHPTEDGVDCVDVNAPHVVLSATKQRVDLSEYTESSDFTFDDAFDETATNAEVYASCVPELLDVALQGGSASVFAYGQTGSGKTYTMMGGATPGEADSGEPGLYLLAAADLFRRMSPSQRLLVSFYEIYCNSLFDLLNARSPVVLREDGNRKVNICGLSWHDSSSPEALWDIMKAGQEQRRTGSTSANERSSRSHAVMSIKIKDASQPGWEGMLNFVDLAGSERGADTVNNDRLTRLEGAEINKSLLALKECIRSLDERKRHVPFRGSRLTEVLRDSFTGNSKTVMVANVSPSARNYEHTANTVRYAFRVKGLSIASVVPCKARNAPRPFQPSPPVTRSRGKPSCSPPNSRIAAAAGEEIASAEGAANARSKATRGGGPTPSRERPRPRRTRTGSRSRERRSSSTRKRPPPHGALSPTPNPLSGALAGREDSHEPSEVSAIALLVGRDDVSLPLLPYPLLSDQPPPSPLIANSRRLPRANDHPVSPGQERSPQGSGAGRGASGHSANVALEDQSAGDTSNDEDGVYMSRKQFKSMESRLRRRIMGQLRDDIGKEIQQVLDERDSLIAALKAENATLREAVLRLEAERAAALVSSEEERETNRRDRNGEGERATPKRLNPSWFEI